MERMGDILAKTATRRASLRTKRSTQASGDVATPSTSNTQAKRPSTTSARLRGQNAPVSAPARTPKAASAPRARMAPVVPDAGGYAPTPASTREMPADRILEMPARYIASPRAKASADGQPAQTEPGMPQVPRRAAGAAQPIPAMRRPATQRAGGMNSLGDVARGIAGERTRRSANSRGTQAQPAMASRLTAEADVCPVCRGAGYVRLDVPVGDPSFGQAVPCVCKERQREERRRSDLRRLSSLDPFMDKTFETFDATIPGVREALEVARHYAEDPQGWLMLMGTYGTGKTHLAAAIANYRLAAGSPVFFSIVPDLLDHLRATFAPSSEVPYDELFDKVREAEVLVLDDLGAENGTAWATEKLFQIINYRYNFRMPTVITTNNRLLHHMDERIRSRLSDISLVRHVIIEAQDYRDRRAGRAPRAQGGSTSGGRRGYSR